MQLLTENSLLVWISERATLGFHEYVTLAKISFKATPGWDFTECNHWLRLHFLQFLAETSSLIATPGAEISQIASTGWMELR
jgi:hypothetical protein